MTTSERLAHEVSDWTDRFIQELSRGDIIRKSLDNYGHILVAETIADAIDAANEIASEHMEIVTANPFEVMTKIRNAGAIFIGEYSSERSVTILRDRIMCFLQTVLPSSSPRFPWTTLLRSPASSHTQGMRWKRSIQTLKNLLKPNISQHMQTPSKYD